MDKAVFKKNQMKKILFIIILFLQVFEYALFEASSSFKCLDEMLAIISLVYVFLIVTTTRSIFLRFEAKLIGCLIIVIIIGLLSNLIFSYQPLESMISDLLIFSKFILGYFLSRFLFRNADIDMVKRAVIKICRAASVILMVSLVVNIFTNIFPHYIDFRFFMYSQQLFFGHPTFMGSTCVALMTLLMGFKEEGKNNTFYILLCIFVAFFSFRFKILVFLVFFAVFMFYESKKKQIGKFIIAVIIIAGLVFSYQQISYYYVDNMDFARNVLTVTSFKVANDHFPFGAGFATYGSFQSGVNYSPIYHMYGIDHVWGMTKRQHPFISDTFWPMIIGQFGYIGLIFFLLFLLILMRMINKLRNLSYSFYYSSLACLVYLIISSTSESSFVQPFAVLFFYIIGTYVSQLVVKQEKTLYMGEIKNENTAYKQVLFYKGRQRNVLFRSKKAFGTKWP